MSELDDVLEIRMDDNGPGIPENIRHAVYAEGKRGITTKEWGTGHGMATNKDLIEALGGKVFAERNEMGGTRIRILFPR